MEKYLIQSTSKISWDVNGWGLVSDAGEVKGNPLDRDFPVATNNMGGKVGYVTSLDGGRAKEGGLPRAGGANGTEIAALDVEEDGAKCDELAGLAEASA